MDNQTGRSLQGYEVLDRIGSGGFGVVYRAYQSTVGREVAIKIILPGFASRPDFIRRFQAEAQLIARLEHLHIVPLYDFWRDPSGAYLVMRWLKGGNLQDALAKAPFDLPSIALFLDQIASALSFAHANGVVHRDLQPANILMDEEGNFYLSDFGIALDVHAKEGKQVGNSDQFLATDYISPERARNGPIGPQSDIYSLGVILYQILTREHPFPNVSPVDRLFKHINDPLPQIETLPPEIREAINAVIQKATAKNPRQRYSDALEMAVDFRQAAKLFSSRPVNILEDLTLREQEVLALIVEGRTNREIAQSRYIELSTVKWYIRQIYRKLDVRSRRQAVVRAREAKLFSKDGGAGISAENQPEVSAPLQVEPTNPYKGLRAFELADAREFFGREASVKKLLAWLEPNKPTWEHLSPPGQGRFLAIVGPSGSGKTSLIKAGLIPALMAGALDGSERWFYAQMEPGSRPMDQLEVALVRLATDQAGNLRDHLTRDQFGLARIANLILPNDGSKLVLVIDQFEELFTLVQTEYERTQFLELLSAAALEPNSRMIILVALRADFYDRPLIYPVFGELARNCLETVLPLSAEELERAILQPAMLHGVTFEPGLVAKIIEDVFYQPGALPMLQYSLAELFEQRQENVLTHAAYQAIGGASGALANRADELWVEMDSAGQQALRQIFLRLVSFGDDDSSLTQPVYTRRRVLRSELLGLADEELVDEILDTYSRYRLLSLDHEPRTRRPTVELAHEAMLTKWERLRLLLDESREDLLTQRRLSNLVSDWESSGHDPAYLLRGSRLDQFSGWAANSSLTLTEPERSFINSSQLAHDSRRAEEQARQQHEIETTRKLAETEARRAQDQANSNRRLRWLAAGLGVLLLAAILLAGLALQQRQQARAAALLSGSRELAAAAVSNLSVDPERSILLSLQALTFADTYEAVNALHQAVQTSRLSRTLQANEQPIIGVNFNKDGSQLATSSEDGTARIWETSTGKVLLTLTGHTAMINYVAYSPDGTRLATASDDGSAKVWDAKTGQELFTLPGHIGYVTTAVYNPDEKSLVTTGEDGTIRIWNAQSGEIIRIIPGYSQMIRDLAFSPDGSRLVTVGDDQTARIWEASTGRAILTLTANQNELLGVAYSPDGKYIATAGGNGTAKLWDAFNGDELQSFTSHTNAVQGIAFSPSGDRLATGGYDGRVKIWSIPDGKELISMSSRPVLIFRVAFSPDGTQVAAANSDGTTQLWDISPGKEFILLTGHQKPLNSVLYSSDGERLLTASDDGTAAIWDSSTGQSLVWLRGHTSLILRAVFNQDGSRVATASDDLTARIWDSSTGKELVKFTGHTAGPGTPFVGVMDVAFDPAGNRLATAGADSTIRIWDIASGKQLTQLDGHTDRVNSIAYSPDGSRLTSGSDDQTIKIWDTASGKEIITLPGHKARVWRVVFNPDGTQIASGSSDATVILWDAHTGKQLKTLSGHTSTVFTVVYNQQNDRLASASIDGTVKVWDLQTGEELLTLDDQHVAVPGVAFSPDGSHLATASDNGTAQVYFLRLDDLENYAFSRLTRWFTPEECQRYLHSADCPVEP